MNVEKLKRINGFIKRSFDTWIWMKPLGIPESTKRVNRANGFVITREVDSTLGVSKTTIDHSSGRLDVIMSFAPLSMDRWLRIRIGSCMAIGFERSKSFPKGTHAKTIMKWIEEQLFEGLKCYE